MKVLVYMRDGRTVYRISNRHSLHELVTHEPWQASGSYVVDRGVWNPHTGLYGWTRQKLRYISKGSIACVEEAHPLDDPPTEQP